MINQLQNSQSSENTAPYSWSNPLPGEKPLWFNRFVLYRDLGAKRSLVAALLKEQEQIKLIGEAPEGTQNKIRQAPGSWKQASTTYHWSERAKAFDLAIIQVLSEKELKRLARTTANKYVRLSILNKSIGTYIKFMDDNRHMSVKEHIQYAKLIRDLLKDVKSEMEGMDDEMMMHFLNSYGVASYGVFSPEKIATIKAKSNLDERDCSELFDQQFLKFLQ